jgi:hypothetical protein
VTVLPVPGGPARRIAGREVSLKLEKSEVIRERLRGC